MFYTNINVREYFFLTHELLLTFSVATFAVLGCTSLPNCLNLVFTGLETFTTRWNKSVPSTRRSLRRFFFDAIVDPGRVRRTILFTVGQALLPVTVLYFSLMDRQECLSYGRTRTFAPLRFVRERTLHCRPDGLRYPNGRIAIRPYAATFFNLDFAVLQPEASDSSV